GRVLLPAEVEAGVVHAVRPAVDAQHHGVLAGGIEVRRLDDPALDAEAVQRRVPDLLDLAQLHAGKDVAVDGGELADLTRSAQRERDDVLRLLRAGEHAHGVAVPADVGDREHVFALGDGAHLPAAHGREVQVAGTLAADVEVDAAAVRRPPQALWRAVEALGEEA